MCVNLVVVRKLFEKLRCFPGKFTELGQILHDRRSRRSRQISSLSPCMIVPIEEVSGVIILKWVSGDFWKLLIAKDVLRRKIEKESDEILSHLSISVNWEREASLEGDLPYQCSIKFPMKLSTRHHCVLHYLLYSVIFCVPHQLHCVPYKTMLNWNTPGFPRTRAKQYPGFLHMKHQWKQNTFSISISMSF